MMIRDDLSNKLVHLIRGDTTEDAYRVLERILDECRLKGGNGMIKGEFNCVCFTETPISKLGYVLTNNTAMRYKPLGIMVDKSYVFDRGGRPVIYQADDEYELLPKELRYRHVRLEWRDGKATVDFTWEREWRIHTDELPLKPEEITVILPKRIWRDALSDAHFERIHRLLASDGIRAAREVKAYPWHVIVLEDLGIPIPDGYND
jgi:hypothetical protein